MATPEIFKSKLRLFVSIDLTNSTMLKQCSEIDEQSLPGWLTTLTSFYKTVEADFSSAWTIQKGRMNELDISSGKDPELWKSIGDELIFVKELTDSRQAYWCLDAWIKATDSIRKSLREKNKNSKLNVKLASWLAGFPAINVEVIQSTDLKECKNFETYDAQSPLHNNIILLKRFYESNERSGLVRDFIGPSIDIGFRISSSSTPRKMMVSIDLALMIAKVRGASSPEDTPPKLELRYDGKKMLKGVLGNKPYPMFWVDTMPGSEEEISNQEAEILGFKLSSIENIKVFVDNFISKHGGDLFCCMPYIINDKASLFNKKQPPIKHKNIIDAYTAMHKGISN